VVHPAPNDRREGETEDDFVERIKAKDVPADATNVAVVDTVDLPYRGRLRNAWRQAGAVAPHMDMAEARAVHLGHLRQKRNRLLAELDVAFIRAVETGDAGAQAEIARKKQWLRDMPQHVQPELDAIADPAVLDIHEPAWP
jgi:hypothetical protein